MKHTLRRDQVTKVWKSMPGGAHRFMKDWGPQAFADALMDELNKNTAHESIADDSLYLGLRHRAVQAGYRSVSHALDAAIALKSTERNTDESAEKAVLSTPPNRWSEDDEKDPHGSSYDCERAGLTLGHYTDDELANGAFMNYDRPLAVQDMLTPKEGRYMPIVWMTAVKDRIRWLSRALVRAQTSAATAQQQIRNDVLEEAAKVCDDLYPKHDLRYQEQHAYANGVRECATALRSKKVENEQTRTTNEN